MGRFWHARPDDAELDEEIRGHIALSIQDRVEAGQTPDAARDAALREFGNTALTRESLQSVWRPQWVERALDFSRDVHLARRSLSRARGLAATVVITLALGIGANAAAFSVVRDVLLRPLVNRDESTLIYLRQSAPGLGDDNIAFSVPEIADLRARATTLAAFGDFATVEFRLTGLGEPRTLQAGVVNGSYFEVMGLRPVLGRLIDARDDGPGAQRVAVITHRFWTDALSGDPSIVGRGIRLDGQDTTVIGVLEPSLPYPAQTQIIANVVTSSHHLEATMVTERTHRMTQLFGRLAPGVTIDDARQELERIHRAMMREHPRAYPARAAVALQLSPLREEITAPARGMLWLLAGAAALVFLVACANVANLILARGVRRESELAVCASLGASRAALRRMLLAESLLLSGAGAAVGIVLAYPLVFLISRFVSRFTVRALDVRVDASLLWVGAALAMAAALLLAYVPRLPGAQRATGFGVTAGALRVTPGTNRRLRVFATAQIAFSFVLLAGAGALTATLISLQRAHTGYPMRQVLAVDVPTPLNDAGPRATAFVRDAIERVAALPGVEAVSAATTVPWRDAGSLPLLQFKVDTAVSDIHDQPHARMRMVAPGFFEVMQLPLLAGREFAAEDRRGTEPVAIINAHLAQRYFPRGDAIGRTVWWTEPMLGRPLPRRIVGIVADVDDEHVVAEPGFTIYLPVAQIGMGGRLFVRTAGNPYDLVPAITAAIRGISEEQPVERAATLADIRAQVLAPERANAVAIGAFAAVALLIAVVGVAGTLAFSVSARTREFGVRLAIGCPRPVLLLRVLREGAGIALAGIAAGALITYLFAGAAFAALAQLRGPGWIPLVAAALVLAGAALAAALMPAARASRIDVLQALRTE